MEKVARIKELSVDQALPTMREFVRAACFFKDLFKISLWQSMLLYNSRGFTNILF